MFERLFGNTAVDPATAERIPPGQYRTEKFPVLHYGSVPRVDLATWDFKVWGEVDAPFTLTWQQFKELPRKTIHTDVHCVTRWSKLDTDWEGVAIRAGHHCTQPLHERLGEAASARASMYVYSDRDDIDRLAAGLRKVTAVFGVAPPMTSAPSGSSRTKRSADAPAATVRVP